MNQPNQHPERTQAGATGEKPLTLSEEELLSLLTDQGCVMPMCDPTPIRKSAKKDYSATDLDGNL